MFGTGINILHFSRSDIVSFKKEYIVNSPKISIKAE